MIDVYAPREATGSRGRDRVDDKCTSLVAQVCKYTYVCVVCQCMSKVSVFVYVRACARVFCISV